jgi:microcystin-dependent protein
MALITSTIQNVDVAKLKHEIESAGNYKVQSITVTSTGVDVVVLTPTGAELSESEVTTLKTSVIDAHQSQQRRRILVTDAPVNVDEAGNLGSINTVVDQRISEIVDGAPGVLDTLNELSQALGGDPNFATTITTQIGDISDTTSAIDIRVQAVESDVATVLSSIQQESVDRVAGDLDTLTTAQSYTNTQVDALENTLATVATTGSYNDLTNKPTISTAGASGSYTDLTNKPTIPSTINELSDVAVFTPETNQLLKFNGTQWVNAQSYFGTGSYNDLNDKPSLDTVATTGSYNDLNDKPSLATVATTGSYNDLTNQPTLPSAIPTGMIAPFAGAAAPAGWLMCNDLPHSRETYGALFATIGVSYGSGDGSTTFNVPDLRRRFPVGAGASDTLGYTESNNNVGLAYASRSLSHSHTISHTHTIQEHTHTVPSHQHAIGSHTHTVNSHSHTVNNHSHSANTLRACIGVDLGSATSGISLGQDGNIKWYSQYRWTASGVSINDPSSMQNSTIVFGNTSWETPGTSLETPGTTGPSAGSVTGGLTAFTTNLGEGGVSTNTQSTTSSGTQTPPHVIVNYIIKT